jgi:hypothetical protein
VTSNPARASAVATVAVPHIGSATVPPAVRTSRTAATMTSTSRLLLPR